MLLETTCSGRVSLALDLPDADKALDHKWTAHGTLTSIPLLFFSHVRILIWFLSCFVSFYHTFCLILFYVTLL